MEQKFGWKEYIQITEELAGFEKSLLWDKMGNRELEQELTPHTGMHAFAYGLCFCGRKGWEWGQGATCL